MNKLFSLGIITDEVSQDLNVVSEFMTRHSISDMEIRSVNGRGVFDLTEEDVKEIEAICREKSLRVVALSSPTYKCSFYDEAAVKANQEGFMKCVQIAKRLGARWIRVFDFWEEGVSLEERAKMYQPLIQVCEENDLVCALEYDPSVHSNTPEKAAKLLAAINHPRVRGLFDPGNGIWSEPEVKPYPDGYNAMKPYLCHVHVKDAKIIGGKPDAVKVGTGWVDYKGLLAELVRTGYQGSIMLETHYRLNTVLTEEQLKRPGGSSFSDGAYSASDESLTALKNLIDAIV